MTRKMQFLEGELIFKRVENKVSGLKMMFY